MQQAYCIVLVQRRYGFYTFQEGSSLIDEFKTWSTMSFFFLAMVMYPECQARAQKEIDAVIGSGRLPEFDDRSSLPYVECLLQETLRYVLYLYHFIVWLFRRWHSAVPLGGFNPKLKRLPWHLLTMLFTGVPHRSTEDDIYKGMFIPKGSLVIANTRYIHLQY